MKKKRHSVEQITAILKQAERGAPVGGLCRQVGIAEQASNYPEPARRELTGDVFGVPLTLEFARHVH